jgi:hypothetical protein
VRREINVKQLTPPESSHLPAQAARSENEPVWACGRRSDAAGIRGGRGVMVGGVCVVVRSLGYVSMEKNGGSKTARRGDCVVFTGLLLFCCCLG